MYCPDVNMAVGGTYMRRGGPLGSCKKNCILQFMSNTLPHAGRHTHMETKIHFYILVQKGPPSAKAILRNDARCEEVKLLQRYHEVAVI